jgi:hypothetical protein
MARPGLIRLFVSDVHSFYLQHVYSLPQSSPRMVYVLYQQMQKNSSTRT